MSTDSDLPAEELITAGAAADSSEDDRDLLRLPRILRYALLSKYRVEDARHRLFAEIAETDCDLTLAEHWFAKRGPKTATKLATGLDRLAVNKDSPDYRSLADSVRLLSLPCPRGVSYRRDFDRVAKAVLIASENLSVELKVQAEIEAFVYGWAALPLMQNGQRTYPKGAADAAWEVGAAAARVRMKAVERETREQLAREGSKPKSSIETSTPAKNAADAIPPGHVIVCRLSEDATKNPKLRELMAPFKHVINIPLRLAAVPPLKEVREHLLFEFPYAGEAIDFALDDLIGRITVKLRPLLVVGASGGGKSRFARRLGEALGVDIWRTDASRSDGATFGGTDKRWSTAEPCHPLLAIAQAKVANPVVLIDEIEKAGTRSDYGRLWDCLLGFLEPETASQYPDPALQTPLDLSHLSYVATANSLNPLPTPLRDRFRIVSFPTPRAEDIDALLPSVLADISAERGLSLVWTAPLAPVERDMAAAAWKGGSVRRLRRIVDAIVRARESTASRH